ncbi:MAG: hypothetical protein ACE5OZ_24255 [Candidatus Heimdallarchaeota archaeon]
MTPKKAKASKESSKEAPIIREPILDKEDFIETATLASGIQKNILIGNERSNLNWEAAYIPTSQTQGKKALGIKHEWWVYWHLSGIEPIYEKTPLGNSKRKLILDQTSLKIPIYFQDRPQDPSVHMSIEDVKFWELIEDWPETRELYNELRRFIQYSVELKENYHYSALALYIMATYLFEACSAFPYLSVIGYKQTGKSRLALVLSSTCYHAKKTVSISGATIFRYSHSERATLIFDINNLGKRLRYDSETLDFIKEGYKQGASVGRQIDKRKSGLETKFFNAYCPKCFLTLEGTDEILEDRAFSLSMTRTLNNEIRNRSETALEVQGKRIRAKLYAWKLSIAQEYDESQIAEIQGIDSRIWELARPLIGVASRIDSQAKDDLTKFLYEQREEKILDEADSLECKLTEILKEIVISHQQTSLTDAKTRSIFIPVKEIKKKCDLCGLANENGDPLSNRAIGYKMKALGYKKHRSSKSRGYRVSEAEVDKNLEGFNMPEVPSQTSETSQMSQLNDEYDVCVIYDSTSGIKDNEILNPQTTVNEQKVWELIETAPNQEITVKEAILKTGFIDSIVREIFLELFRQGKVKETKPDCWQLIIKQEEIDEAQPEKNHSRNSSQSLCKKCNTNRILSKGLCRHCLLQAQLPNTRSDGSDNGGSES